RQRLEKKRLDGSFLSSVVARVWREALEDRASVFAIVAGGCDHDEGGGVVAGSARRSRDGAQDIDRERIDRVEIVDEERDRAWRAQREERLRDAVRGDLLTHAGVDVRVAGLALDGLLDSAKESRARRIETKPREPTCPARDESRGSDFDAAAILAHEVATDLEPESKLAQEPRLPASRRSSNEENAGACARSSRVACSNDAVDELRGRPNEGRREPEREVRVDPCGRAEELDGGGVRGRGAIARLGREERKDSVAKRGRQIIAARWIASDSVRDELRRRLAPVRHVAQEDLVEDRAERVEVASAIGWRASQSLRGEIVRRAGDEAARLRWLAGVEREAKVDELRARPLAFGLGDHDVRRLEIAVDEPLAMKKRQAVEELEGDASKPLVSSARLGLRRKMLPSPGREVRAGTELHCERGPSVLRRGEL